MKILWFTNTSSLFNIESGGYNGGGWISSLETLLKAEPSIELGISFYSSSNEKRVFKNNTVYYPISIYSKKIAKIKHNVFYETYDSIELLEYKRVIDDFNPDVIHIFGTEKSFGLIGKITNIPIVIHIQGLMTPYLNAWLPPGTSVFDYYRYLSPETLFLKLKSLRFFKHGAKREEVIISINKNFTGRTSWDRAITKLYSPNSTYFHCDEILRTPFYEADSWKLTESAELRIVTTISKVDYKGFDLILKTAQILKRICKKEFVWKIYGIKDYSFWEKKLGVKASENNIEYMGVGGAIEIINTIQNSDFYVHSSYIDNSPNSLCEAQLLGIPVISTNVGGIPSLIENEVTGILVPANDPYLLAQKLIDLHKNKNIVESLGKNGRLAAVERHDKLKILKQNLFVYKQLIEK